MKKIKLMLVAFMAMIGVNAFAAGTLVNTYIETNQGVKYLITEINKATGKYEVVAYGSDYATKGAAALVIPAELKWSVNGTDNQTTPVAVNEEITFKVVGIGDNAFKDGTTMTSLKIGKNVLSIGASAFNGCNKLASIEFEEGSALTTLKDYAFGNTPALTKIDFTNCTKLQYFTDDGKVKGTNNYTSPFIPAAAKENKYLKEIVLNVAADSETKDFGTALAYLPKLATVNITATKATLVAANAFVNDKALTTLELPATVKDIADGAFTDSYIEDLTINSDAFTGDGFPTIGATAAAKLTSVTFVGEFKGVIAASAFVDNEDLATVTFADLSGSAAIGANAFGISAATKTTSLTEITFGEIKNGIAADKIAAAAFVLEQDAAATIEFTKISDADAIAAGAFVDNSAVGSTIALNLPAIAAAIDNNLVAVTNAGKVDITATVGTITAAISPVDVLNTAKTIKFTAALGEGGAFIAPTGALDASNIKKVYFGTETEGIALAAGAVPASTFVDATGMEIWWVPATATKAFAVDAFKTTAKGGTYDTSSTTKAKNALGYMTGMDIVFHTTFGVCETYQNPYLGTTEQINNIFIAAAASTAAIKMLAPEGSSVFYAKFHATGDVKIAKEGTDKAKITVYSAYVDESDGAIMIVPLRLIDGAYLIPAGQNVIIRSTSNADVEAQAITAPATNSMWSSGGAVLNELTNTNLTAVTPANTLIDPAADLGKEVWVLKNFAKFNKVDFSIPGASVDLPACSFYVHCPASLSARIHVVFVDEDEATAIMSAKKSVKENGAIYNLAGQKVNASYKGVVIKNGKKYIQK